MDTLERLSEVGRLLYQLISDFPFLETAPTSGNLNIPSLQHIITQFHRYPTTTVAKQQILEKVVQFDQKMILEDPVNLNKLLNFGVWHIDIDISAIELWLSSLFHSLHQVKDKYLSQMGNITITDVTCFVFMYILLRKREEEQIKLQYGYCDVADNVHRFWKSLLYYQHLYQEDKSLIKYNTKSFSEFKDLYSLRHIAVFMEDEIRKAVGLQPNELFMLIAFLRKASQVEYIYRNEIDWIRMRV